MLTLTANAQVLRWYFEQIRAHKILSIKAVGASFAATVLLDAVIPYNITVIFEMLWRGASFGEFVLPLVCIALGSVGVCILIPYRIAARRQLQDQGQLGLSEKIAKIVTDSPSLSLAGDRGVLLGSMKRHFATWSEVLIGVIELLVPFVVGTLSLLVVLALKAPGALLPVFVILVIALWLVCRIGGDLDNAWIRYNERENEEFSVLADLVASSSMLWLARTLARIRERRAVKRSEAMGAYIREISHYNFWRYAYGGSMKVAAILLGVVCVTQFQASIGVVAILVMYSLTFSERLNMVFGINEIIGHSLIEAKILIARLEGVERLGPRLTEKASTVTFTGVTVRLGDDENGTPQTVISLPDMCFDPGITMLSGPSGCGKTTALRLLARVLKYVAGSVTIGDCEVAEFDVRESVFYGQQAYDRLSQTPFELFGGDGVDLSAREAALSYAGYSDAPMDREVSSLSGGQIRRLCMALLFYEVVRRDRTRAGVLCLDEPTNDLDDNCVRSLLDGVVLLAAGDPELVVVVVSHDDRVKTIVNTVIEM